MGEKKIKLVIRRSSLGLKIVVLAMVVLCIVALLAIWLFKEQAKDDLEQLRSEAVELEKANNRLTEAIDKMGTVQGILQVAKEELGLVDPNTIIIEPAQ